MRILLACEFFYPSVGGVQEVMRQLSQRLVAAGHNVVVATSFLAERQSRHIGGVIVEEFRISGNLVSGMRGEVERYRDYILKQDYDVLLIKAAQQWTFDALTSVLGSVTKPKIFVPCGFSGLFDPAYESYFKSMPAWLAHFDRLIFYTSRYRDIEFAHQHNLKNLVVLSNGADEKEFDVSIDPNFRSRHGVPDDAFLVLTVGSFTGLKGHLEVAKAFEQCDFGERGVCLILNGNQPRPASFGEHGWFVNSPLLAPIGTSLMLYRAGGLTRVVKWIVRRTLEAWHLDWLLILAGYPRRQESLQGVVRRINRMSHRKAVTCNLSRSELVQAYLQSDLFVFASKVEYSPLVLFEAAAAGLPFLSVPVGNAGEIAQWTQGGVICPAQHNANGYVEVDVLHLAKEMARLSQNPQQLAQLAANGKRSFQERFTWDKICRDYEKVMEECIKSSKYESTGEHNVRVSA